MTTGELREFDRAHPEIEVSAAREQAEEHLFDDWNDDEVDEYLDAEEEAEEAERGD